MQLGYFTAEKIGGVDFVSERVEHYRIDGDAFDLAQELSGSRNPSSEYCDYAYSQIIDRRIQYLSSLGMVEKRMKYRRDGSEHVYAMAIWVGDIVPNQQVQNTMAISAGYPRSDHYRY